MKLLMAFQETVPPPVMDLIMQMMEAENSVSSPTSAVPKGEKVIIMKSTAKQSGPSESKSTANRNSLPVTPNNASSKSSSSTTPSVRSFFAPKNTTNSAAKTPLPPGFSKTISTRPTGKEDPTYHGPDGSTFRSYVAVKRYCAENGIAIPSGDDEVAGMAHKIGRDADSGTDENKSPKFVVVLDVASKPSSGSEEIPQGHLQGKEVEIVQGPVSEDEEEIPLTRRLKTSKVILACALLIWRFGKNMAEHEVLQLNTLKPKIVQSAPPCNTMDESDDEEVVIPKRRASTNRKTGRKRAIFDDDSDFEDHQKSDSESVTEETNSSDADGTEAETEGETEEDEKKQDETSETMATKAGISKKATIVSDDDENEAESDEVQDVHPRKQQSIPQKKMLQPSLTSFFGGGGGGTGKSSVTSTPVKRKAPLQKKPVPKKSKLNDEEADGDNDPLADLEPINQLHEMFADMITRVPNLFETVKQLSKERPPLRVATMCSGTESPLLAIKLISDALSAKLGVPDILKVHHVFSCEIEPFKQAYIDRNFSPPILFRDVKELSNKVATTAYGSLVPVPGNVDILIAGTSCVDYSSLNNKKLGIESGGESGDTFNGMLGWVDTHRPPLVILENVCGAPWDMVVDKFDGIGYDAAFMRADTKHYYIPHTRTRVYLIALSRDDNLGYSSDLAEKWKSVFKSISRKASTPLEDYLLPTDDPRIHIARQDLAKQKDVSSSSSNRRTDWSRCESRHAFARINEELGNKRPLTAWSEGGMSNYPDYAWNDWGRTQTDRVLDLSDINYLRIAKTGVDVMYKTLVWNLSQNVDRNTASSHPGVCPCLTPTMIAYITNRGGPLVGIEALSLQGIPVDELLLTRETEDQLADLAGNAMTSTVVGAAFLAAIVVGVNGLVAQKKLLEDAGLVAEEQDQQATDKSAVAMTANDRVVGTEALEVHDLNLGTETISQVKDILEAASKTCRHCVCEGRDGIATTAIQKCVECNHTACINCGGRPEHVYDTQALIQPQSRSSASAFSALLKKSLPARLYLTWMTNDQLLALAESMKPSPKEVDDDLFKSWANIVSAALAPKNSESEFRFSGLKRQELWTVHYIGAHARLVLSLEARQPGWSLYLEIPKGTPPALREILERPVARMKMDVQTLSGKPLEEGFTAGEWEIFLPALYKFKVCITGQGQLIDSWEARLGLEGKFKGTQVWSHWKVSLEAKEGGGNDVAAMDEDITGVYRSIGKCGTSMDYLHKRENSEHASKDLYFFMDPTRCGKAVADSFIFSSHSRRLEFKEQRLPVLMLDTTWRPSSVEGKQFVDCFVHGFWSTAGKSFGLKTKKSGNLVQADASIATLSMSAFAPLIESLSFRALSCSAAVALVQVKVDLGEYREDAWGVHEWNEVDLVKKGKSVFEKVAWFADRIKMPAWISEWTFMEAGALSLSDLDCNSSPCVRCAPIEPRILWIPNVKGNAKTFRAIEDPSQAGVFENALKNRPAPFVCQLKLEDAKESSGVFRIGLNFASLIHRAAARLTGASSSSDFEFSWRINCNAVHESSAKSLPKLELRSNRNDPGFEQPPNFKKYPLRPEQLRSLSWMIKREQEPGLFVEEEISEASFDYLGWRAEGRASRAVQVRGGVVADQVGYGKTAITLGLIDYTKNCTPADSTPADVHGKIPLKATLILVPGHLLKQWPSEIAKFTGTSLSCITIKDVGSLNKISISDFMKADVIIASSKIFASQKYWENFEVFAAEGKLPPDAKKGGRYFNARYKECLTALRLQIERLKKGEMKELIKEIEEAADKAANEEANQKNAALLQTKRKKGKQYRDEKEAAQAGDDEDEGAEPTISKSSKPAKKHKLGSSITDPWGLTNSDVKKSWKKMTSVLFEMFSWNRVVVDEFTYLADRIHAGVVNLNALNKWVLSGTPPVKNFSDIKSIAVFLGVNLGVDDESDFTGTVAKRRKNEATRAEQFHAFREIHTHEWHARRHQIAQKFLDQFVRQNIAEIDEIISEEVLVKVDLPPAERAIYLELEHHLQALDMNSKKAIKFKAGMDGDRDRRMVKALGCSSTAEEALMKRCSHFALDDDAGQMDGSTAEEKSDDENSGDEDDVPVASTSLSSARVNRLLTAAETCKEIVTTRKLQLVECIRDIWIQLHRIDRVRRAAKTRADYKEHCDAIRTKDENEAVDHFDKWVRMVGSGGHVGDAESMAVMVAIIQKARVVDKGSTAADLLLEAQERLVGEKKSVCVDAKSEELRIRGLIDVDMDQTFKKLESGLSKSKSNSQSEKPAKKKAKKDEGAEEDDLNEFEAELAKIPSSAGKTKSPLVEVLHFIRELTHSVERLQKELVGRMRSLRFFVAVDRIVLSDERFGILRNAIANCASTSCKTKQSSVADTPYLIKNSALLSCCGHMGCVSCLTTASANQKCLEPGCTIVVHDKSIVPVSIFGDLSATDAANSMASGRFGAKLMSLIKILTEKVLPAKEKALIFVQFDDLMAKVGEALDSVGIGHLEIKGTSHQKSQALDQFQTSSKGKSGKVSSVLLLNVADESAAGANLTVANHIFLLNPLHHSSNEWIQACETQAVGRCRRYGQDRKVWVHRMLANDTIDTVLFEKRVKYLEG
ncbi:hypothetical protein HDU81_000159 [Chytriomyces hyalinus]|nr:hypothetical protein HDU81_000159 [Chytriomyces hyalinus]